MSDELLEVTGLTKWFPVNKGFLTNVMGSGPAQYVQAVDGVDFQLRRGEVLGLAGESGAGKSTIGRLILSLIQPTKGQILFDGIDVGNLDDKGMRELRRRMQVVFQDPLASMNPRMTVGESVIYPARLHLKDIPKAEHRALVLETLRDVGLDPPEIYYEKYPHQLSGGQRQRAVIARALITAPDLVVLDEPIAMADVSVRTLLLDLLKRLKKEHDLTYLYITHDLATAKYICDRIAVLYLGKIVEIGSVDEVFRNPRHPYTRALLAAVPVPDPTRRRSEPLPRGEIPDPIHPPPGCQFHPRCSIAVEGICDNEEPGLEPDDMDSSHLASCHLETGVHQDKRPA